MRREALLLAGLLAGATPSAAQTPAVAPGEMPLVYSTVPMTQSADLTVAATIFAGSGGNVLLRQVWPSALDVARASRQVST